MLIGITGSTGVIGKRLLQTLEYSKISQFKGKIENFRDVNKWISKNDLDVIIHLAAVVPLVTVNVNKRYAKDVNYNGTKNLIKSIKENYKHKKIWLFYASTSHIYNFSLKKVKETDKPNPINYYGKTKYMSEKYIIRNKKFFNYCIGRIFSLTDKFQKKPYFIPTINEKLKSKKKVLFFSNTGHFRDFLPIEDICNAIIFLLNKKARGIFNISSSKKVFLTNVVKKLNYKKKKLYFTKTLYPTTLIGDNAKIKKIGWKPSSYDYLKYIVKLFR